MAVFLRYKLPCPRHVQKLAYPCQPYMGPCPVARYFLCYACPLAVALLCSSCRLKGLESETKAERSLSSLESKPDIRIGHLFPGGRPRRRNRIDRTRKSFVCVRSLLVVCPCSEEGHPRRRSLQCDARFDEVTFVVFWSSISPPDPEFLTSDSFPCPSSPHVQGQASLTPEYGVEKLEGSIASTRSPKMGSTTLPHATVVDDIGLPTATSNSAPSYETASTPTRSLRGGNPAREHGSLVVYRHLRAVVSARRFFSLSYPFKFHASGRRSRLG